MHLLNLFLHNFFSFILLISFIVFIHEFGHFWVARLCGVKVDAFAIGFGRELFGFTDKKNTRWKICLIPLGGYVKMFGDKNEASVPDLEQAKMMSDADKKQSFIFKNVYQRIAIVAAGPVANFILTIVIFTFLFRLNGLNTVSTVLDEILPDSAAFSADLKKGDKVLAIDGREIKTFDEMRELVVSSLNEDLLFKIQRGEKVFDVKIRPKIQVREDVFGDEVKMPTLGVTPSEVVHEDLNLLQSFVQANKETYKISLAILKATGELITGKRSVKELGGPIKIAKYTGKTVEMGVTAVLWFMAMISLNLGVMNLLPVPVLDGGHLIFYIFEAIFRKPLPQKVQQNAFKVGMALVLSLMIFTTLNDFKQLFQ